MLKRLMTPAAVAAALALAVTAAPATASAETADVSEVGPQVCAQEPVTAGYYRMWRDVSTTKEADRAPNVQRLDDVPAEIDILSVFATKPEEDPDFWNALKTTYLAELRAQGTQVVFTLFVDDFIGTDIAMTQAAYDARARELYDTYIVKWGLDGLDIDVERQLTGDQLTRATGVLTALGELIGPRSGSGRLFIYDTNLTGAHPLFRALAPMIDYVFLQAYGRSVTSLQGTWETFAPFISSCQFLPGFSFYEERGTWWGDTTTPIETSRAAAYAAWQPTGGEKAGIFAYAIDRDGKVRGDDTITRTDFSWMIWLSRFMDDNDIVPVVVEPDTTLPEVSVGVNDRTAVITASDDTELAFVSAELYDRKDDTLVATLGSTPTSTTIGSDTWSGTWTVPTSVKHGKYVMRVVATDTSGNTATTALAVKIRR